MNLGNLTWGEIKQLKDLFTNKSLITENWGKQIVILQRGWVAIGDLTKKGCYMELDNAYIIRRWGTTGGLGQLAKEGKQENTELESTPRMKFHELTVISLIEVDANKW